MPNGPIDNGDSLDLGLISFRIMFFKFIDEKRCIGMGRKRLPKVEYCSGLGCAMKELGVIEALPGCHVAAMIVIYRVTCGFGGGYNL